MKKWIYAALFCVVVWNEAGASVRMLTGKFKWLPSIQDVEVSRNFEPIPEPHLAEHPKVKVSAFDFLSFVVRQADRRAKIINLKEAVCLDTWADRPCFLLGQRIAFTRGRSGQFHNNGGFDDKRAGLPDVFQFHRRDISVGGNAPALHIPVIP